MILSNSLTLNGFKFNAGNLSRDNEEMALYLNEIALGERRTD